MAVPPGAIKIGGGGLEITCSLRYKIGRIPILDSIALKVLSRSHASFSSFLRTILDCLEMKSFDEAFSRRVHYGPASYLPTLPKGQQQMNATIYFEKRDCHANESPLANNYMTHDNLLYARSWNTTCI